MEIIDIKTSSQFIKQYVELRNSYADLLLTDIISIESTAEWITNNSNADVEIRLIVEDGLLTGAVLLYLHRGGEVAFFVKDKNKGIGSRLLAVIEQVAKDRLCNTIWAWVRSDNLIAQHVFVKNGFDKTESIQRIYKRIAIDGFTFTKNLYPFKQYHEDQFPAP